VNFPLVTLPEEPPQQLLYRDAEPLEQQMWVGVVGQVKTHNVEHSVLSYIRYILNQVGAGSYGDLFGVLLPAAIAQRLVREVKYEFRVQPGKVFVEIPKRDRPALTNFFMLRGRLASPVRRRSNLWVCTLAVTEQTRVVDYPTLTLELEKLPEGLVYHQGAARRHQPLLRFVGELRTRQTRRTALNYIRYILRRVRASDSADLFEMFLPTDVGRRIIRETEYNLLVNTEKIVIEKQPSRPEAAVNTRVLTEPVPAEDAGEEEVEDAGEEEVGDAGEEVEVAAEEEVEVAAEEEVEVAAEEEVEVAAEEEVEVAAEEEVEVAKGGVEA